MSDAATAYEAAREAISRAKRDGALQLNFSDEAFWLDLHTLPPEIAELTWLQELWLAGTRVSDLSPLRGLTNLRTLRLEGAPVTDLTPIKAMTVLKTLILDETNVTDLTPLSGLSALRLLQFGSTQVVDLAPVRNLTSLENLDLSGTQVTDLSPIQTLTNLRGLALDGTRRLTDLRPIKDLHSLTELHYGGSAACALDPEGLGKLVQISNNQERTEKTLAYLRGLTVWPPVPLESPAQDDVLQVAPNDEGRLDTAPVRPGSEEVAERQKSTLYPRLQEAFGDLALATGNQQPEVSRRARAAQSRFPADFSQADMITLYLEVVWAQGQLDRRGERQGDERFTNDAVAALNDIVAIGPGLILDNPEVQKLEERRSRFANDSVSVETALKQGSLAEAIAIEPQVFGETLREYAALSQVTAFDPANRGRVFQNSLIKNVVIAAGLFIVGNFIQGVASAAADPLVGPPAKAVADWLVANGSTIMAAAPAWGDMFLAWLRPVLEQARAVAAAAHSAGAMRPTFPSHRRP